jgi:Spy/CpxP family protein refolding chaperone
VQVQLKDITLTPEQQAKVDAILSRYRGQMPAITRGTPPDSATRTKVRELMHSQDAEIRAVLTPEQQTVWDRNAAELRARRPGGS